LDKGKTIILVAQSFGTVNVSMGVVLYGGVRAETALGKTALV